MNNNPKVNIKKKVAPHFRISKQKKLQCNQRERDREVKCKVKKMQETPFHCFSLTIEFRVEREKRERALQLARHIIRDDHVRGT